MAGWIPALSKGCLIPNWSRTSESQEGSSKQMPNWKTVLKVGDLHAALREKTMTVQDVAKIVARRLTKNPYVTDPELDTLIDELKCLAEKEDATADEYDEVLDLLYTYGDEDHRIWVDASRV